MIAALLDQDLRARTFWRMSILLPYVVTPVAVAIIFSSIFSEADGLANNLLELFGLDPISVEARDGFRQPHRHRDDGQLALDRLQRPHPPRRDAGRAARHLRVRRARRRRRRPPVLLDHDPHRSGRRSIFVIITSTIGGLQIFTEPQLFDPSTAGGIGGSDRQFQTTVLYLWELAFFRRNFGEASAVAWLLFLLIVVFGADQLPDLPAHRHGGRPTRPRGAPDCASRSASAAVRRPRRTQPHDAPPPRAAAPRCSATP